MLSGLFLLVLAFLAWPDPAVPVTSMPHDFMKGSQRLPNGQFANPIPTAMSGFADMPRILLRFIKRPAEIGEPAKAIPVRFAAPNRFAQKPGSQTSVQWLGHSSLVIELGRRRYLLDPVLSERVSMFQWMGPKRLHLAPVKASEIRNVDAVIISHDHYDHLDYNTILALKDSVPLFIVPLEVKKILVDWGVPAEKVKELDWGQQLTDGQNKVVATPARHFSGRSLARNKTLWSSYCLIGETERIFFTGDSGEMPLFSHIGEQYGPFDLTLIPIGAYDKDWQPIHTDPTEGLEAHRQLRGKRLMPIHWATFDLGLHSWGEPIDRLEKEAAALGVELVTPEVGEQVNPYTHQNKNWWSGLLRK